MAADAVFEGAATIRVAGPRGMVLLRIAPDDEAAAAAAAEAVGASLPGRRAVAEGPEGRAILWFSPDEFLILCPYEAAPGLAEALAARLEGHHALVLDVSDMRALFRIEGEGAREVLAKGAPVDLAPGAFGPGEVRRTRLGQVAVAFWMVNATDFELVCFRSVADYVFEWLCAAARPGSLPGALIPAG
ncbi:MAG: sarcosine oxidase subunit gamma [Alphaproteobacteria bacterium]|nr:MAG: sarcosine oxidase subunit gamma [Alphaproteobacteria bacterium]